MTPWLLFQYVFFTIFGIGAAVCLVGLFALLLLMFWFWLTD